MLQLRYQQQFCQSQKKLNLQSLYHITSPQFQESYDGSSFVGYIKTNGKERYLTATWFLSCLTRDLVCTKDHLYGTIIMCIRRLNSFYTDMQENSKLDILTLFL